MLMPPLNSIEDIRQYVAQVGRETGTWPSTLRLGRRAFVMLANETDPPMTKTGISAALGLKVEIV